MFAEELAQEYQVEKGKSIPMGLGVNLDDFQQDEEPTRMPFRELVGSLMWLATQIRPDTSNAVRAVARYCASPRMIHWHAALKILGYVKEISSLKIMFRRGSFDGLMLQAYADANYASRAADMRSVSGGLIMCGG